MAKRKIDYYKIREGGNGNNYVKVETYYKLGGMNYGTYRNEPRGYYISVSPVEVTLDENGQIYSTLYAAFSGACGLFAECNRQNKTDYERAKAFAEYNALDIIATNLPGIIVEEQPEFSEEI